MGIRELVGPSMETRRRHAHVVQTHLLLCPPGLRLEEDGVSIGALRAGVVLCLRERRVVHDVSHDLRQLADFVHELVHVDALVIGHLLVLAVSARVEQLATVLVLARVQHVVAERAELDADEAGASSHRDL
ncbi:hypothetical protein PMAYCL1PPCAC_28410, partial [Pristionchus mayeri]